MSKQKLEPLVAVHRSIFVALSAPEMPRQRSRALWAKIAGGATVDERYMTRFRAAARLAEDQIKAFLDEMGAREEVGECVTLREPAA